MQTRPRDKDGLKREGFELRSEIMECYFSAIMSSIVPNWTISLNFSLNTIMYISRKIVSSIKASK